MLNETRHISVLLKEVLESLDAQSGGVFFDGTFGGGGHTKAILSANQENKVFASDKDVHAHERAKTLIHTYEGRLVLLHGSFYETLSEVPSDIRFKGVLLDLGMSTDQLYEQRGFSFKDEHSLDMRMDVTQEVTAEMLINELSEKELSRLFKEGGVGRDSKKYASVIVRNRPFTKASEVGEIIAAVTYDKGDAHPATVVFQALRIAVNKELEELNNFLSKIPEMMDKGGRLAIISFHSLEDTVVTRAMRKWESTGDDAPAWYPGVREVRKSLGKLLTKKAIFPTQEEIERNAASRSARMRVFEFSGVS